MGVAQNFYARFGEWLAGQCRKKSVRDETSRTPASDDGSGG
jgi:hypothetical protein